MEMLNESSKLITILKQNAKDFRKQMEDAGFYIVKGNTAIVPVMLFNAKLSQDFSKDLYDEGIYAIGFFFPVVPNGKSQD